MQLNTSTEPRPIARIDHFSANHRADFFGIPVVNLPMHELISEIEGHVLRRESTHIVNLNPYHFLLGRQDAEFKTVCSRGDIVFADGIGIVLASMLHKKGIRHRYTGLDVMVDLCSLSAKKGYTIFLVGGQHGIVDQCASILKLYHPGLRIVGALEPPHVNSIEEFDNETIVRMVNEAGPDILFVALGAPKQEKWIEHYRDKLNVPIMMGVGGSFDIVGGRFPRAPRWMRALGLEWLFRLGIEPRRLAGRYLVGIPRFLLLVVRLKFRSLGDRPSQ
jgi:N-acetylglucosaminyldiphosphoundecaprenol N-acetyl-beta-D-mannosaminyltransferase